MDRNIRPPSEANRIAAEGVEISLNGKIHRLKYGFRSYRFLEAEFGSIGHFVERLQQTEWGEDRVRAICVGITAGLLHEKPAEVAVPAFQESIEEELNFADFANWVNSMTMAMAEGFPAPQPGAAAPKGRGSRNSSRGTATTSSRRSPMAARTRPSGR